MPKTFFIRKPATLQELLSGTDRISIMLTSPPTDEYYVAHEQHLPADQWNELLSNFVADRDWIRTFSKKEHPRRGEAVPAIRVTGEKADRALVIDPQGYDYPRYIGLEQV